MANKFCPSAVVLYQPCNQFGFRPNGLQALGNGNGAYFSELLSKFAGDAGLKTREGHVKVFARRDWGVEFVNDGGFHTNKIEGHWRQMKVRLPTYSRKKENYSSYLAEFKWRYIHSGEDLWKAFLKEIKKIYKFE